jgi:trk system potassium uptake protein TrkH
MTNLRPVLLVIGTLLATLGCAEMLPAIYDLSLGNSDWKVFAASSLMTIFIGITISLTTRGDNTNISIRQAFIMTAGSWVALTGFGAIPFTISSLHLSYSDAFFETMSAITTTGATVISGLDKAPPGILLWRGELQWLGGLGVIVMAIAGLPILKVGGMQLFKVEAFDTAGKILPRATQISGALTGVYVALTSICAISYAFAGMSNFDAVVHAMTTVATGGMSNHDASLGHFDSLYIELICILFMILGSLPFLLYVRLLQGHPLALIRDAQVRGFFKIAAMATFLAWLAQATGGYEPGFLELRDAGFAVVSLMTGTGYTTVDYSKWSVFAVSLFFIVTFIGGCSGSTSCGIKVFRFQIISISLRNSSRQLLHPHAVFPQTYNGHTLPDSAVSSVMIFLFLFVVSFFAISGILELMGLDLITAMSATATSMANVGPGLGDLVGPAGNFASLSSPVKWVLSYAMLLGRLEVFTILVFLLPSFWLV